MTYKDPEKQKAFQREWQRKQRKERKLAAIEMLGGECSKCGYKENYLALQIDHIKAVRRKDKNEHGGTELHRKILKGEVSLKTVQLLCANCHTIKTYELDRITFKNYIR